jgi:hypothetical protein
MRLLERKPDGDLVFRESTDKDVPAYAILSHTWLTNNNEEVSFQDRGGHRQVRAYRDHGKLRDAHHSNYLYKR